MADLIYLSGPPGVGKSTLMAHLTAGLRRAPHRKPFAHDELLDGSGRPVAVELGHHREAFPGTDTLSMGVAPLAYAWIAGRPAELVLAEGDRLASRGFLRAATEAGYTAWLVDLDAPEPVLVARRDARGSRQNPTWVKGRVTKARRLAANAIEYGWSLISLDATRPTPDLAAELHGAIAALSALPQEAR